MTATEGFGGRWFSVQLALCGFAGRQVTGPCRQDLQLPLTRASRGRPSRGSVAWLIGQLGGLVMVAVAAIIQVAFEAIDESGSTGVGDNDAPDDKLFVIGWVAFAGLGFVDRCLLLRVALAQTRRLTELAMRHGRREHLRLRISDTARRLSIALWLPLVVGECARWIHGKTIEEQATIWWVLISIFMVVLPCVSLGAAAILLWAEVLTIDEYVSGIIDGVLADTESDRDVAKLLQSFVQLRGSLEVFNQEWEWVLVVQLLVCVSILAWEVAALVFATGNLDVGNTFNFYVTGLSTVAQVFWPLVVSIFAVVRVNRVLDAVPNRITTKLIFTPVSESHHHQLYLHARGRSTTDWPVVTHGSVRLQSELTCYVSLPGGAVLLCRRLQAPGNGLSRDGNPVDIRTTGADDGIVLRAVHTSNRSSVAWITVNKSMAILTVYQRICTSPRPAASSVGHTCHGGTGVTARREGCRTPDV
jgi:hypothetical protein